MKNKLRAPSIIVFFFCFLVTATSQYRENDFLDLTKPLPSQKTRLVMRGSGGGAVTSENNLAKKLAPLKIDLLSVDRHSYHLGDPALYEVTLQNITRETLIIPWSADYDRVKPDEDRDPRGYVYASLSLVIEDKVAGNQFIASQSIYGSQLAPGSLKILRPGQRVTIRATGTWWFADQRVSARVLGELPQNFGVRASYTLYNRMTHYEPAVSANGISIELRKH